ncbi:MAG: hypothetical protein D6741_17585 [Planctomycetota bacterium]|nr:MAG: hypothetical protein D6741_17585 [Planctomycetota bacterium]
MSNAERVQPPAASASMVPFDRRIAPPIFPHAVRSQPHASRTRRKAYVGRKPERNTNEVEG